MVRYIVAIVLTAAGAIFVRVAKASTASFVPDTAVELPPSAIWRIWAADMMTDFWWLLIPFLAIVCLAIAMMFGPPSHNPNK
jgi:hypothetical protein